MNKALLDDWVYRLADLVRLGRKVEDDNVELKLEWPSDLAKAARRIAGCCNACSGPHFLWVIGMIDAKEGKDGKPGQESKIAPTSDAEMSTWMQGITKAMDGFSPDVQHQLVHLEEGTVVALLFDTTRRPFLVGAKQGSGIEREVPWRHATQIGSAKRENLLRMLVPVMESPTLEMMSFDVVLQGQQAEWQASNPVRQKPYYLWDIRASIYIVPGSERKLSLAAHNCELWVTLPGRQPLKVEFDFAVNVGGHDETPILSTKREAIIRAGGLLNLSAAIPESMREVPEGTVDATFSAQPAGADAASRCSVSVLWIERMPAGVWVGSKSPKLEFTYLD